MLRQMTWPPQSPDLNPTEMVWDELDRRVKEKQPTRAQHLWECQEFVKLSSKEKLATWKNLKYKTYSGLFNAFLFTT